jgi:hypothetical protein
VSREVSLLEDYLAAAVAACAFNIALPGPEARYEKMEELDPNTNQSQYRGGS